MNHTTPRQLLLAATLLAATLLLGCGDDTPVAVPVDAGAPDAPAAAWQTARYPATAANGAVQIHFTRPGTERGAEEDPEADDAIIEAMATAESNIDLCLYEFNRHSLVEAIEAAVVRGIQVRFVGDGDELEDEGYERLSALGVEMALRKPRDRIMHNKFVIIDANTVFTGSMNYSENGLMLNNNNLLRIDSADLADVYAAEFQQMFDGTVFGRKKARLDIPQQVRIAGRSVEVFFSPQDNPVVEVVKLLDHAEHSVYFMIFSFTHADILAKLIALHNDGVEVVGVFDESQARGRYSVDETLAAAGVPTYIDGNKNAIGFAGGKLHHKVMIIDGGTDSDPTVITGSFNWSKNATRYNDENLLALHGGDYVSPFLEEFCAIAEVATLHPSFKGEATDPCANLMISVRINEFMANPAGIDRTEEYVELVNTGAAAVQMEGWTLGDVVRSDRHTFGRVVLAPGASLVVYSGTNDAEPHRRLATSGRLALNNNADTITLANGEGTILDQVAYQRAMSGVAFNRAPDGGRAGAFEPHPALEGRFRSPGLRTDGTMWPGQPLLLINELLPNPDGTDLGQEFVELFNGGTGPLDLTGWTLGDRSNPARHVFENTVIYPGDVVVIFDRGEHDAVYNAITSSTGSLSLNNTGDTITLYDPSGMVMDQVIYASSSNGISKNRLIDGDINAALINHDDAPNITAQQSPGLHADLSAWVLPPPIVQLIINELLPNPRGTDLGQEFIELVNVGEAAVDLSGYSLGDAVNDSRHAFGGGVVVEPGQAIVVFDRGEHLEVPGALTSSSGSLSLNNTGDTVRLFHPDGTIMDAVVYTSSTEGVSLNRAIDGSVASPLVPHSELGDAQSPGTQADGTAWP